MADDLPPPEDFVSQPHEIIRMDYGPNEQPTEGEWKRALAERRMIEKCRAEHVPDPSSNIEQITQPLRGERFVAIPQGCHSIVYLWEIGEHVNGTAIQ